MEEVWKAIDGYPGHEVSNLGGVRSIDHKVDHANCKSYSVNGKIKKGLLSKRGYLRIQLKSKHPIHSVHRLVALAFISNPYNLPEVNHKNGVKIDNRVENLEWCSRQENATHAKVNKLLNPDKGSNHWNAKLDDVQVQTIRVCLTNGITGYKLARYFKISDSVIYNIKNGKAWPMVSL